MGEIEVSRSGTITVIRLRGEYDLADVEQLNRQLRTAFADEASSCLLDLSPATFIDSSIINAAVTWSREAQLSEREALAIFVAPDTAPSRVLDVVGLRNHLPIFSTEEAAMLALREGQRQRTERSLAWLTDAELAAKVERAQWASDAAAQELKDLQAEPAPPRGRRTGTAAGRLIRQRRSKRGTSREVLTCPVLAVRSKEPLPSRGSNGRAANGGGEGLIGTTAGAMCADARPGRHGVGAHVAAPTVRRAVEPGRQPA